MFRGITARHLKPRLDPTGPVLRKQNRCQGVLLAFLGIAIFSLHVAVLATKDSWITMVGGLRYSTEAFIPGANIPLGRGTFPTLRTCYVIAEARSDVVGFTWVLSGNPATNPTQVTCNFKSVNATFSDETSTQTVVKTPDTAACGVFRCRDMPNSRTTDIYNCDILKTYVKLSQAFGVISVLFIAIHMLFYLMFISTKTGQRIGCLLPQFAKLHALQVLFITLTWVMLVTAYAAMLCGRRVRSIADLHFAVYVLIAETALTVLCHKLTQSAYWWDDTCTDETETAEMEKK
eukprot:Sspe_Gene.82701::Locus_54212_Transcript_1_1_Confidence_1.000_Length_1707::g.82701::m.82701